ncbi:hypothetical protein GCM10011352_35510 [Marinobacterium zhoushanense]|uniref:Uncharacterized protein n=1 Tax=Marinobacterium zhoushanense TaxID=1679163 RepID=A0ABQ1KS31_9GAMM|nr:hypothetical protein GCM10011352_35510 [Marinobacterium zhoushanense]
MQFYTDTIDHAGDPLGDAFGITGSTGVKEAYLVHRLSNSLAVYGGAPNYHHGHIIKRQSRAKTADCLSI